ncbi:hypothetical protein CRG98_007865 [Punica granatum]|nr:hypothetical protein CRG98_007865 [Punica granatum]
MPTSTHEDKNRPTEFYDFLNVNSDSGATTRSEVTDPTRRLDYRQPHEALEEEEEVDQAAKNNDRDDDDQHHRGNSSNVPFIDFLSVGSS